MPQSTLAISLDISADTLLVGDARSLSATTVDTKSGQPVELTVQWSTADPAVAGVDAQGRVTARGAGIARIIAMAETVSDTAIITVESAAELKLSRASASLASGDTLLLTAAIVGSGGSQFTDRIITWSSSDSAVAAVSPSGLVIAGDGGTASITARWGTLSGTLAVAVTPPAAASCTAAGTAHTGTITSEIWRAAASPHFINGPVNATGKLIIEPGATICFGPDAWLLVADLHAVGTANRKIRFTATNAASRWKAIEAASNGDLLIAHALIEHGSVIVSAFASGTVSDSHLRHTPYHSGGNFSSNSLVRTVVDTGDVTITNGRFDSSIVRAGGLVLWSPNQGGSGITLNGGRVENSPDIALSVGDNFRYRWPVVVMEAPIRIVGSRGPPVDMPLGIYQTVWKERAAQDSLVGNPYDTLTLRNTAAGSVPVGELHVRRDLPVRLWSVTAPTVLDNLTMEPGSSLDVGTFLGINGNLNISGTTDQPITIRSSTTQCWGSGSCPFTLQGEATSRFTNVRLDDVNFRATGHHTAHLERVTANASLSIGSPGSTLSDVRIEGVLPDLLAPNGALALGAEGIRVERVQVRGTSGVSSVATRDSAGNIRFDDVPLAAILVSGSNVSIRDCDVLDNQSDGIRVMSGSNVTIHTCNLERNGGFGVANHGLNTVDARRNWWGDPSGPFGPAGDGASGPVHINEALTSRR